MKKRLNPDSIPGVFFLVVFLGVTSPSAWGAVSPEQDTLRVSKLLKPISDEDWSALTQGKDAEQYRVEKGDTLFDISKRLFGDGKYWPKIWAINNSTVTNPHHIKPGFDIAFYGGSGVSLPSLKVEKLPDGTEMSEPVAHSPDKAKHRRSNEWRHLPRQPWETIEFSYKQNAPIDPTGFDERSKIRYSESHRNELRIFVSTQQIEALGELTGATTESRNVSNGDLVFMQGFQELKQGAIYSLTGEPKKIRSSDDRVAYAYQNLGDVEITQIRDQLYVGRIRNTKHPIPRGSFVVPFVEPFKRIDPIAAQTAVEGNVYLDHELTTDRVAQFRQLYVNRGASDGVVVGNVFRAYYHHDPSTQDQFTSQDFVNYADILVIQTSENFCTGVILHGTHVVAEGARVVLLTDVSSLRGDRKSGVRTVEELSPAPPPLPPTPSETPVAPAPEAPPATDEDLLGAPALEEPAPPALPEAPPAMPAEPEKKSEDLEAIEPGTDLNETQKKELKQLENWDGQTVPEEIPPPAPGSTEAVPPAEASPATEAPPTTDEDILWTDDGSIPEAPPLEE